MSRTWKLDSFDSEVFGFKTAKVAKINSPKDIKALNKDFVSSNVTYATYRLSAKEYSLIHELEKNGWILVDGILALELKFSNIFDYEINPNIGKAELQDHSSLVSLAKQLFSVNRLYNDPFIDKEKADLFYGKWMENSLFGKAADSVLIWKEKKENLGFVTIQKSGHVPLIGVSYNARNKGVGKSLIKAALSKILLYGSKTARIETQITNIPAIRVYSDCGFKVVDSFLTFRWVNKV